MITFSQGPTSYHALVLFLANLTEINTGAKPWTLHYCTLDMTHLHRRHTNSGNPVGWIHLLKCLRTTKTVVVVRVRWRIVVAISDPHVLFCIVPGTAAQDAGTSA